MSEISKREAVPVAIGMITLYCESFKASAVTALYEQPTVTGTPIQTNKCKKATKLTLSGRVYDADSPLSVVTYINNITGKGTMFISYRGIRFSRCMMQSYTAEDKGDDFIYLTVTLTTNSKAENIHSGGDTE
jgi:hypothetical protein